MVTVVKRPLKDSGYLRGNVVSTLFSELRGRLRESKSNDLIDGPFALYEAASYIAAISQEYSLAIDMIKSDKFILGLMPDRDRSDRIDVIEKQATADLSRLYKMERLIYKAASSAASKSLYGGDVPKDALYALQEVMRHEHSYLLDSTKIVTTMHGSTVSVSTFTYLNGIGALEMSNYSGNTYVKITPRGEKMHNLYNNLYSEDSFS